MNVDVMIPGRSALNEMFSLSLPNARDVRLELIKKSLCRLVFTLSNRIAYD